MRTPGRPPKKRNSSLRSFQKDLREALRPGCSCAGPAHGELRRRGRRSAHLPRPAKLQPCREALAAALRVRRQNPPRSVGAIRPRRHPDRPRAPGQGGRPSEQPTVSTCSDDAHAPVFYGFRNPGVSRAFALGFWAPSTHCKQTAAFGLSHFLQERPCGREAVILIRRAKVASGVINSHGSGLS